MNTTLHRGEPDCGTDGMPAASPPARPAFDAALQHYQAGRLAQAELLCREVLAAEPSHDNSLNLLGVIAFQTGRHDMALKLIGDAIAIAPDKVFFHTNLGNMLLEVGRPEEALACHQRAVTLDPALPEAHDNLGNVLRELEQFDAAIACYRRAIVLNPDRPATYVNLAAAHLRLGQADEALACCRAAIRLKPDFPEAHCYLSAVHTLLGQPDEVIACCRAAIRLRPGYPEAYNNLAMALLATGDMAEGWAAYEWRWKVEPGLTRQRNFAQPQWLGEAAEGQTLLIHAEQGYGDTLQFCRYAPLAHDRGLRVIVEAPYNLVRLLHSLRGVDRVVAAGEALPEFDLHCPMLSLPLALGTTLATIPGSTPYLYPDTVEAMAWRTRLAAADSEGPRVGLAWAGSPRPDLPIAAEIGRRRSLPPDRLTPLLQVPGIQFFGLQKGGPAAQAGCRLIDHMDEMRDFADTAALIVNLDLVVSVDTAVAHLAAALGRPVCLLDRFDHCWRWLAGRRDSPWYPMMRIYRQPQPGDWDAVLAEVAGDLQSLAEAWQAAWAGRAGTMQAG